LEGENSPRKGKRSQGVGVIRVKRGRAEEEVAGKKKLERGWVREGWSHTGGR